MMVLDASTAVAGLLGTGAANQILRAGGLNAPHLIDSEICHVLRRQAAARTLTEPQAVAALAVWQRLAVTRHPVAGLLGRMWELRENLTAYDAGYVALAEVLGCPLATGDARLARSPGPRCPITVLPN